MNFDRLYAWIIPIVVAAAITGNIDSLQRWIWTAQAKTIVASRTSNWGSPRFFPDRPFADKVVVKKSKSQK